jgi:hypothetical protein
MVEHYRARERREERIQRIVLRGSLGLKKGGQVEGVIGKLDDYHTCVFCVATDDEPGRLERRDPLGGQAVGAVVIANHGRLAADRSGPGAGDDPHHAGFADE